MSLDYQHLKSHLIAVGKQKKSLVISKIEFTKNSPSDAAHHPPIVIELIHFNNYPIKLKLFMTCVYESIRLVIIFFLQS